MITDLKTLTFWAKTTDDKKPGIDVYSHMLNVFAVAKQIVSMHNTLLKRINLDISQISVLAGLHDIGKISQQFQRKCSEWLNRYNLTDIDICYGWDNSSMPNHAQVSQYTIYNLLRENNLDFLSSSLWSASIGAHHGKLSYSGERGLRSQNGMKDDDWEETRRALAKKFINEFGVLPDLKVKADNSFLWWLAGLTTVSDWIGSDEYFFPNDKGLIKEEAEGKAREALDKIGFGKPNFKIWHSLSELFPHIIYPNSLQLKAIEYIVEPGIYIIEAPMGMGKTEAALGAASILINKELANGIYFALPTQVTSNRIYLRVQEFISLASVGSNDVRLIHGNSWLVDKTLNVPDLQDSPDETDDEKKDKFDWFSSSKRTLLSTFGVGTVDQALMGVIAVKHFFVRQFALAGKVVILDEVHSYDMYTGTLINQLCKSLVELGATVIILSATLTTERRIELIGKSDESEKINDSYPLISGRTTENIILKPVSAVPPEDKDINVVLYDEQQAIDDTWSKIEQGCSVLWICDTVAKSQDIYNIFKDTAKDRGIDAGLLHSRFPFFRRDEIETEWLGRLGKDNHDRKGCILVSTQIVEQSVDIDADLIITELAPTDMLLQRIGRLWRHPRGKRPVDRPAIWIIKESFCVEESYEMSASDIRKGFGSKAYVYDPYVLLRTYAEWEPVQSIDIPSKIRRTLEGTYRDKEHEPASWGELKSEMLKSKSRLANQAKINANVWSMPALPDEENIMTRINSQQVVSVIIAKEINERSIIFLDGSEIQLEQCLNDKKNMEIGRALNRNFVKVPKWVFDNVISDEWLSKYFSGWVVIEVPDNDGFLNNKSLKDGFKLNWSMDAGMQIVKPYGVCDESNE